MKKAVVEAGIHPEKGSDLATVQSLDGIIGNVSGRVRTNLVAALVMILLFSGFCVTSYFMPNANAWPTKYGSCSNSGCHVQIDPDATITTAINGVVGTSVTVAAGGTFEVDWKFTNVTNAAGGQVGVGVEINLPTGWGLAKGTVNSPAIPGWNAVWDAADGVPAGWATANSYSAAVQYPASPVGYTINYDTTAWDTGTRNAAYDNATAGKDLDGIADNMGADAIVTVPAGTAAGSYQVAVLGVGHDSAKSHVEQIITVTVTSGGGGDTTKPVVSAGFAATTPSLSKTIPVSGFAATDNTGVTGYIITTSSTAPLAGAAGWTATAPTSYTVAADGSYTLYPWAKDAAGNVSNVYASPVAVFVDSTKPVVSAGFAATTPSLSRTITVSGFAATDANGVTGYMITTSSTAPLAGDAGWLGTAPTNYTVASDGSFTLYPWAKDTYGNVSAVYGTPVAVVVDTVQPTVSSTVPVNGATGTNLNGAVTLNFSENINCTTVTTSTVTISPAVGWTRSSCSGTQAVFAPSGQANTTTYTVTVGAAVADTAGNTVAASYPFSYTTSAPAPNNAPGAPATLVQYKSDGTTVLTKGLYTNLTTLVFKGTVTDPDSDTVQLDIELVDVAAGFTGTPTCSSTLVTSGSTAAATCSGILNGRFKWQARATDSKGATGSWTQY
ncbi:Ig-like domain-containing protein [Geomonas subterranea]|uniref:Ig-like domain-containing protein n=1 Tax=Geomonas subterranea TaxID=2847989 RepID=A0ABX8LFP5_9BACT|nr:Ig-like domain-containing protein [Geomonas subterranea]QXE90538.1 Ig-like domain-containing protein [Geomonas subterranea]QXM11384.1 Ig-like domain-containing protein [Geomonas subterranea]